MTILPDCFSVLAGMQRARTAEPCAFEQRTERVVDGQIVSATVRSCRKAQCFSLNTLPSLGSAQPFLSCRLCRWTAVYVSAVCGIVYSLFLLLFYLSRVLEQLLVLVLYTKIVWVLLSDF